MSSFFVVGTDHNFQERDPGLEGLLRSLLSLHFVEPLTAIAEEYHDKIGNSIAQRLAREGNLRWYNVDMTSEEKSKAGILTDQRSRPMSTDGVAYRVPSDEAREHAWTEKLGASGAGTTLIICGYLHSASLVAKLRAKGHTVDQRVYLDDVPEIRDVPVPDLPRN